MTVQPAIIRAYPPTQLDLEEAIYLSGAKYQSTLMRWIRRGWLPRPKKLGRRNFWHTAEFVAALDRIHQRGTHSADEREANRTRTIREARRAARRGQRAAP
jgi:predicted DNA-binding transcriptional regulator AlpA